MRKMEKESPRRKKYKPVNGFYIQRINKNTQCPETQKSGQIIKYFTDSAKLKRHQAVNRRHRQCVSPINPIFRIFQNSYFFSR